MNNSDNKLRHPAVPPLYPTNPCRNRPYIPDPILDDPYYGDGCYGQEPIYYEPHPIQEPIYYEPTPMPHDPYGAYPHDPYMHDPYMDCPMMDPRFMDCMRVCMRMRCGKHNPYVPYSTEENTSVDSEYEKFQYINLHKLNPYYPPESE